MLLFSILIGVFYPKGGKLNKLCPENFTFEIFYCNNEAYSLIKSVSNPAWSIFTEGQVWSKLVLSNIQSWKKSHQAKKQN